MMNSERDESVLINLEIQGNVISCNRNDLIKNSDYFKAMLDGNFAESNKNQIALQDVSLEAIQIILKLLWDREYAIGNDQILPVLQTASMLQFLEVKDICINTLTETLSAVNCLQVWFFTEQLQINSLYLKAKLLALLEFESVKELDSFIDLTLREVCCYLGSINLQAKNELSVFKAAIKWYDNYSVKSDETLVKLLLCLDFTNLKTEEYNEILSNSLIQTQKKVLDFLNKFKSKNDREMFVDILNYSVKCHCRNIRGIPCLLICKWKSKENPPSKSVSMFYYDGFKRKRRLKLLDFVIDSKFSMVYFDNRKNKSKQKIEEILGRNYVDLNGFAVIGWRHYIFIFGGEYYLGKGDWNFSFWKYDFFKNEVLSQRLPFPRRHFETCICDDYLYIVGGTGPYRVIQENMFWFDLKQNKWGPEILLPCTNRQIKCCNFNDRLFLLNINNKNGYFYNQTNSKWIMCNIIDENNLLPLFSQKITVFSYESKLFIKDSSLIVLELNGDKLNVIKEMKMNFCNECRLDSVLCNNTLYTLCKQKCGETDREKILIEKFNIDTNEIVNEDLTENFFTSDQFKQINGFSVYHYYLLNEKDLINEIV